MTAHEHSSHASLSPSPWIVRFAHLVPAGASLLDVASGRGRHARFFAARGVRVLAVDRDGSALASLAGIGGIRTHTADLEREPWPFGAARFDAIVVANYLHRPLLAPLVDALADDGVLLYETFARGNEAYGRPTNPDFLLQRDELLQLARDRLAVVAFEQGVIAAPGGRAVVQRLAALGRARRWPSPLDAVAV
jgi:SAM-dependent methyltransferase